MRNLEIVILTGISVMVLSLAILLLYPLKTDFMVGNDLWNGIATFNSKYGAKWIDSVQDIPEPEGKALIVIPYLEYEEWELERMRDFLLGGGKLIILDDMGYGNQILEFIGANARFTHYPLLDPLFCSKNKFFPKILNFAKGFEDIRNITLNHPTSIEGEGKILALSSPESFLDINGNGEEDDEPRGPFIVACELPIGGGLVLISDPSIIINSMLERDDNHLFLSKIVGGREVVVDISHIEKKRVDVAKLKLLEFREFIKRPYITILILFALFLSIGRYVLWRGRKSSGRG